MSESPNDRYNPSRPSPLALVMLAAVFVGLCLLVAYAGDVEAYLTTRAGQM